MDIDIFESNYLKMASLGSFYPLQIKFDFERFRRELDLRKNDWKVYNKNKPSYKREGLSLFSLNGEVDGEIDLNSVREYNYLNNTAYDEMSFRQATKFWKQLPSISEPLIEIEAHFGRSHLIRFQEGGFFPPHRDLGTAFRLISFLNCSSSSFLFMLNDKKVFFEPDRLYFADTRKTHSVVSFQEDAIVLVLNVSTSNFATNFVLSNTLDL